MNFDKIKQNKSIVENYVAEHEDGDNISVVWNYRHKLGYCWLDDYMYARLAATIEAERAWQRYNAAVNLMLDVAEQNPNDADIEEYKARARELERLYNEQRACEDAAIEEYEAEYERYWDEYNRTHMRELYVG